MLAEKRHASLSDWLIVAFFACGVLAAVAAGWRAHSRYILFAALILAFMWMGSTALWIIHAGAVRWRYVVVECIICAYFAKRWMETNAQHRVFHFVLMAFNMTNITLSLCDIALTNTILRNRFHITYWYQLSINIIYATELLFVVAYSLLRRRAKNDPDKWRSDTDDWLDRFRND